MGSSEIRYNSLPGQPLAHSRHRVGTQLAHSYDYTEEAQRLLVGGLFRAGFLHHFLAMWLLQRYATFICLRFITLQLFPFLLSYISIKISTFLVLQKGNNEEK